MKRRVAILVDGEVVCFVADVVAESKLVGRLRARGVMAELVDVQVTRVIRRRATGKVLKVA